VAQERPPIETVVHEHLSWISWCIREQGVSAFDADDVAHRVVLAVIRYYHTYDPARDLRTWLAVIASRKAHEHLKREATRDKRFISFEQHADEASALAPSNLADSARDPEGMAMATQERQFLEAVLAQLPEMRRRVFRYHDMGGLSISDVAELLGIPVGTVKTHLREARRFIAAALKRQRAADQHCHGASLLPASLTALVANEWARIKELPAEIRAGLLMRVRLALEEATMSRSADDEPEAAPAQDQPSSSRSPPGGFPGNMVPIRTALYACTGSAGLGCIAGAALLWFLLHAGSCADVPLPVPGPWMPDLGQAAPSMVDAGFPLPPALPSGIPSAAPESPQAVTAQSASSSATARPPGPSAPHPAGAEDAEDTLMRSVREAFDLDDFDRARALLDQHAREFPDGKLSGAREAHRARLPR
jgi:RNA polymerase sigma factor (sigma-70 family)